MSRPSFTRSDDVVLTRSFADFECSFNDVSYEFLMTSAQNSFPYPKQTLSVWECGVFGTLYKSEANLHGHYI